MPVSPGRPIPESFVTVTPFAEAFRLLTGNRPFPWQAELYRRFEADRLPAVCHLPTGLGKTNVIAVWLIALVNAIAGTPRRLVYVVNRRTVVDQTTDEVLKLRNHLPRLGSALPELAVSTLRGQFADNRAWSADPARPAVICGTVDMIGSRLLFSGYGVGYKARPLHAGFLGQDVLLVHDEAHLEPAFQQLLEAIRGEQERGTALRPFRVMELSATARGQDDPFTLTDEEQAIPAVLPDPPTEPLHIVWRRQRARKVIVLHEEGKLVDQVVQLAKVHEGTDRAVAVFVRTVDDVTRIVGKLPKGRVQQLTGTLRGLERDRLATRDPIFARFLPPGNRPNDVAPTAGTVYLVCTSAGEVGVNLSADHLVCDLSTFDSMAQRFGRVNRFGDCPESRIDVVYPAEFADKEPDQRRERTLALLRALNGDGSPAALSALDPAQRAAAFAPEPIIPRTSDILFDAWALTSIRGRLPGRPPVEPYLHGVREWEPPETRVAWRDEVGVLTDPERLEAYPPDDLLDDYPLKPHELLRDTTNRVFDRLRKLAAPPDTPVWVIGVNETVTVTTLGRLVEDGKDELAWVTVLLPPSAGGLANGLLDSDSPLADDVADELTDEAGERRRVRVWDDGEVPAGMRCVRTLDLRPEAEGDEEEPARRWWRWYERVRDGDSEGSKTNQRPVAWQVHTDDVVGHTERIVLRLPLDDRLRHALLVAARFHDLGKKRAVWQRSIGNRDVSRPLAKAGRGMTALDLRTDYRHEFGSLLDVTGEPEFAALDEEMKDLVLHLIAVHHGRGRPHFTAAEVFDPERDAAAAQVVAAEVPRRYARLQRCYGRWGLAYLESLLRAADYAASAAPSAFVEDEE